VLGSTSPPSSAGITLGVEHAIYSSADQAGRFGFAKVGGDGSIARWLPESSGVAPVLGSGGALYTGSGNLLARRDDGSSIWSLAGSSFAQGEVVVGADGMLYVAGGTLSGMGLSAVTAAGEIAWHVDANPNLTIATWAAVSRDRAIYFGAADGDSASNVHQSLFAVSRSGQVLWKHVLGDFATVFPVVGHDDNVYVGNGHALWSFDPSGAVRFQVIDPSGERSLLFFAPGNRARRNDLRYLAVRGRRSTERSHGVFQLGTAIVELHPGRRLAVGTRCGSRRHRVHRRRQFARSIEPEWHRALVVHGCGSELLHRARDRFGQLALRSLRSNAVRGSLTRLGRIAAYAMRLGMSAARWLARNSMMRNSARRCLRNGSSSTMASISARVLPTARMIPPSRGILRPEIKK